MRDILNKIKVNIKKYSSLPLVIAVFCFVLLNYIIISSIANQADLSSESFRIHVVANSNDLKDQELKYLVKNKITNYIDNNLKLNKCNSKEDIKTTLVNNINNILAEAEDEIKVKGFDYNVNAKIGKINYTTKLSNYYSMPAGSYDALEISIGKGEGKNWWGLIFPGSISVPDNFYELMEDTNTDNPYDSNANVEFDFKILEVINDIFNINK